MEQDDVKEESQTKSFSLADIAPNYSVKQIIGIRRKRDTEKDLPGNENFKWVYL